MNRTIGRYAALTHLGTVVLFALCMLLGFNAGSYTVCMVMALAYVVMAAAFCQGAAPQHRGAGYAALAFAGMYAAIILLVYFAHTRDCGITSQMLFRTLGCILSRAESMISSWRSPFTRR